jgi:hypothetical protein
MNTCNVHYILILSLLTALSLMSSTNSNVINFRILPQQKEEEMRQFIRDILKSVNEEKQNKLIRAFLEKIDPSHDGRLFAEIKLNRMIIGDGHFEVTFLPSHPSLADPIKN